MKRFIKMKRTAHVELQHEQLPWPLATAAGFCAVGVCSLFWRGLAVSGEVIDISPCLAGAFLSALSAHLVSRDNSRIALALSALFSVACLGIGKAFAWDLFGFMGDGGSDSSFNPRLMPRLMMLWSELPVAVQQLNIYCYLFSPLLAIGISVLLHSTAFVSPVPAKIVTSPSSLTDRKILSAIRNSVSLRSPAFVGGVIAWILAVSLVFAACRSLDRPGFLLLTVPTNHADANVSVLGFAVLVDGHALMAEALPAQEQLTWFSGAIRNDNNFRFKRAGYALLAAHLLPLFGIEGSLLAINVLAWWFCLFAVWQLSQYWFKDTLSAAISTSLAALGVGFLFHADSTTPHLLSFATYYGGILLLVKSRFDAAPQAWNRHLVFGLVCGLIGLIYNTSQMLLLVYWLIGFRCQRWIHLIASSLVAVSFGWLWRGILPGLGINISHADSAYLYEALAFWWERITTSPLGFFGNLGAYTAEALTAFETPWMLLLGIIGACCALQPQQRLMAGAAIAAPIFACVLVSPSATARGYIGYGASIIVFVLAGRVLALGMHRPKLIRAIAILSFLAALTLQIVWDTAHWRGSLGPLKIYFLGWDDGLAVLSNPATEVVDFTGTGPIAKKLDGSTSDRLVYSTPAVEPIFRSRFLAASSRLLFLAGTAALLCVCLRRRQVTSNAVGVLVVMSVVICEWNYRLSPTPPTIFSPNDAIRLESGESIRASVSLQEAVIERVREHLSQPGRECGVFAIKSDGVRVRVRVGERVLVEEASDQQLYELNEAAVLRAMRNGVVLDVTFTNITENASWVGGWQPASQYPHRKTEPNAPVMPAMELRIWESSTGYLHFVAF